MSYLLATVFLCVPLAFSDFFHLVHIPIVLESFGVYEGAKLAIAAFILLLAVFFRSLAPHKQDFFECHSGLLITFGTIFSIFAIHVFQGAIPFAEFFGVAPFFSGFFWTFLFFPLLVLTSQLPKRSMLPLEASAFIALALVLAYAGIQWSGYDPIAYDIPFESGRVFSTLGNPNSYAIYCLLFLPQILLGYRTRWKWLAGLTLFAAIAISGSLSVFFLAGLCIAGALCYEA